jgi:hypothetical protein
MPPTNLDRYRFEVQVKQRNPLAAGGSRYGIYGGRHRLPTTVGGEIDSFAAIWFNDRLGKAIPGKWTLGLRSHTRLAGMGALWGAVEFEEDGEYQPPADGWHTLAVDVAPNGLTWYFDGARVADIALPLDKSVEAQFADDARLPPGIQSAFSPAGGYGLLVKGGPGSFRNARVEPSGR